MGSVTPVFAEANSLNNSIYGDKAEFEVFMDSIFNKKMKEENIPGAVITVVKGDNVFFSKGYGYSDIDKKIPMTTDKTLFRIASITKVFTYTALMQLYEQGKVDLHEDVNKYLKGYNLKNKYPAPVTIEQLLTHTSGIDDNSIGDLTRNESDLKPIKDFLRNHLPQVVREPGKIINYCSYDTALTGGIIEQVSGESLNSLIDKNILKPLNMKNTRMDRNLNPEGLEQGYMYINGKYEKQRLEGYFNNYAVGGIISTCDDMAKFMIANLNNGQYKGKSILKPETVTDMQTRHADFDDRLPGMAYGFNEKYFEGYRAVEHEGYSPDNIFSDMCMFPEEKAGIFISINQGWNDFPNEIVSEIVNKYFPQKPSADDAKKAKHISMSAKELKGFTGTYRFSENPVSTFHKGNAFPEGQDIRISLKNGNSLKMEGKDAFTGKEYKTSITPIEPLVFRREDTGKYVVFKKDSVGKIYYLAQDADSWHGTYERLKWYELSDIQIAICVVTLITFFAAILFYIGRFIYLVVKKKGNLFNSSKKLLLGFIISFLNITFFIAALYVLGEPTRYGISLEAKVLLCVPIISAVLTILFSAAVIFDNIKKSRRLWFRLYNLYIAAAGILYIWFVNYWNLLGFKF